MLGVLFDSKLEWSLQVENSVRKARSSLQGLRVINKYFTTTERLTLLTSFFYSRLYYGSQIWLMPSLKGALKSRLFSASGAALRLLDKNLSFKELHKKYNRATPTQFQKYTTAVSLYDLIKKEIPEEEWINLREIRGWAFRQITNSSVELTVCQTGSSQLQTRLINNGLIWQEMSTKLKARRDLFLKS